MTIRVGSAASPRWWGVALTGLDDFIARLHSWGATHAELVLHHGPADDAIARVHILEPEWSEVSNRVIAAGMTCSVHGPLHPRFSLRRWRPSRAEIEAGFLPVLAHAQSIAQAQGEACVVVIHAANERGQGPAINRNSTLDFLAWASELIATRFPDVGIAVELRHSEDASGDRVDTSRSGILDLVAGAESRSIGICWDFGHDWENSPTEPDWTVEPSAAFLDRVIHVHAHDAGPNTLVHYPIASGKVPILRMLAALRRAAWSGAVTLEIRYRYASELGDPHDQMRRSYFAIRSMIGEDSS